MKILSRADAIVQAQHRYFTGEPCKRGHVAYRYTRTCVCVECHRENGEKNREKVGNVLGKIAPLTVIAHIDDHVNIRAAVASLNALRGIDPQATQVTRRTRGGVIIPDTTTQEYRDSVNAAIAARRAEFPQLPQPHIPAEFRSYE